MPGNDPELSLMGSSAPMPTLFRVACAPYAMEVYQHRSISRKPLRSLRFTDGAETHAGMPIGAHSASLVL